MRIVEACPVCGGTDLTERYPSTFTGTAWQDAVPYFLTNRATAVHGRVMGCSGCGFAFTSPQFAPADYARIYAAVHGEGIGGAAGGVAARYRGLAARVRATETGGRFLDFGCGSGGFIAAMTGFDGVGLEVASGIDGGVRRQGEVLVGDLLADTPQSRTLGLRPESFDFIVAWDVLEHLPDPGQHITRLHALLKPGGRLYLSLPDMASPMARLTGTRWNCLLLEHLWYFTPATLRRFLSGRGFAVEEIGGIGYPVDLATLAARLRQTYGRWLPPLPAAAAGLVVPLPIGLMFARARKLDSLPAPV
ncbi:MAG: class I SAM-dependent methyltransferase [Magnetospirillum sp.]|nr:class I SAM-dependent methyltransferase [Magnetospirillum sp.]